MIIYYTDNFAGGREESHRLLGKALAAYTGDEQRAKALTEALKKGEHGKPFIEGFDCFSISHTGSIWAVLIAESECGLDVQTGRKCDRRRLPKHSAAQFTTPVFLRYQVNMSGSMVTCTSFAIFRSPECLIYTRRCVFITEKA